MDRDLLRLLPGVPKHFRSDVIGFLSSVVASPFDYTSTLIMADFIDENLADVPHLVERSRLIRIADRLRGVGFERSCNPTEGIDELSVGKPDVFDVEVRAILHEEAEVISELCKCGKYFGGDYEFHNFLRCCHDSSSDGYPLALYHSWGFPRAMWGTFVEGERIARYLPLQSWHAPEIEPLRVLNLFGDAVKSPSPWLFRRADRFDLYKNSSILPFMLPDALFSLLRRGVVIREDVTARVYSSRWEAELDAAEALAAFVKSAYALGVSSPLQSITYDPQMIGVLSNTWLHSVGLYQSSLVTMDQAAVEVALGESGKLVRDENEFEFTADDLDGFDYDSGFIGGESGNE